MANECQQQRINMAAKSRGQGLDRVRTKLKTSIESGNYYEAHQMYRTLYFRYTSQKKYENALELLYDGAVLLLEHSQYTSGADLARLMIEVLSKSQEPVSDDYLEKLSFLYGMMQANSPERMEFLNAAVIWSSQGGQGYTCGHPHLHELIANKLWKEKDYAQSRFHFIRSTDGTGCASMLVEYQISKGYPSEVDLFIAQAVFQYLCLKNKSTAVLVFDSYTEQHPQVHKGPPFLLPLLNFLWFLLLAVEQGKLAVFTVLCEQYQPTLTRDPTYQEYLDRIGQLFFGLPPPPAKQQGIFGNFLQSFLGGLEDGEMGSEEGESVAGPSHHLQPVQHEELD